MIKKVKFGIPETTIPENTFISTIDGLVGKLRNVTLEGEFHNKKIYEFEDTMVVLLEFVDSSSKIAAVIFGNRDDEFKSFIREIFVNHKYKIRGTVTVLEDIDEDALYLPFIKELKGKQVFAITAIQDISSNMLFGVDLQETYEFDLETAYNFVRDNTDYLNGISIDNVKYIKFSSYKDIFILLKNGLLLHNGKKKLDNIKTLSFMDSRIIFAFSNDNVITCLTGTWDSTEFMNNNNYKYKKIIITTLSIAALTYEKDIRLFCGFFNGVIDYNRFINVNDIGYVLNEDDIVVFKNDNIYSLLSEKDYSNKKIKIFTEGNLIQKPELASWKWDVTFKDY